MKRLNRTAGLLLLLVGLAMPASGQTALTLQQAVELAHAKSPAADVARYAFEASQWRFRAIEARYLPSVSMLGNAPGLDRAIEGIQQDDGTMRYVPSSRMYSALRMMVSQPIPLTGGEVTVSSGLSRIDLFGDFGANQWQAAPLVVSLTQPLFRFNAFKWERRAQPLRLDVAQRSFAEDLAEIAVDISRRFFDVYIAQMEVENATFNVAVNDTIYRLSQGRFEIGKIAENDLLQSELQYLNAQTSLSNARIDYERAMQNLKLALELPPAVSIEILPPVDVPPLRIDPAEAVRHAARHRSEVRQMDLAVLEAEQEVARARAESGFSADVTASYGLNQSAAALDDVYRDPLDQQRVNISFRMPIFDWGRNRAELEATRIAKAQVEREVEQRRRTIEQEVYFQALELNQLADQVRIAAKADTIATRRFEVARNRYTIGNIDITELFNAQREKDTARQARIQTLRQYWTAFYRLRRLTLYDFVRNAPLAPGG